jgi:hypothetical protein
MRPCTCWPTTGNSGLRYAEARSERTRGGAQRTGLLALFQLPQRATFALGWRANRSHTGPPLPLESPKLDFFRLKWRSRILVQSACLGFSYVTLGEGSHRKSLFSAEWASDDDGIARSHVPAQPAQSSIFHLRARHNRIVTSWIVDPGISRTTSASCRWRQSSCQDRWMSLPKWSRDCSGQTILCGRFLLPCSSHSFAFDSAGCARRFRNVRPCSGAFFECGNRPGGSLHVLAPFLCYLGWICLGPRRILFGACRGAGYAGNPCRHVSGSRPVFCRRAY